MTQTPKSSTGALWARFRFSVVGPLLSSPPARIAQDSHSLACREDVASSCDRMRRSVHGGQHRALVLHGATQARRSAPCLARAVRKDCGKVSLAPVLAERLHLQYRDHPHWSYQLHYDNFAALVEAEPSLGRLRGYSTVRRYMLAHGWVRKPRAEPKRRPGEVRAEERRQTREIRSYEADYVGSLWHLDFHHGSLKVLTPSGQWLHPIALGILDDHSRLCSHIQWYLSETAEDLVHGLSQAIQKRGLPRALLTDNGSAMVAEEVTEGLMRLGILHERTLPYSPYQNGKQEAFWGTLEGWLMRMLDGMAQSTPELLNEATQAWVEIKYNHAVHRETSSSPVDRFAQALHVLHPSSSASRFAMHFAWKPPGASGRATAQFHSRACASRFRHGIIISAMLPCDMPTGTSAELIWSTRAAERVWLPFIPSIRAPTPTATVLSGPFHN